MKYPYIGKGKHTGAVFLFIGKGVALTMHQGLISKYSAFETNIREDLCKNITIEYLQNTYGEAVSPEHAEFIIELAELHGFELARQSNHLGNFFSFDVKKFCFIDTEIIASQYCKKITIPLPPKAEHKIYPQENLGEAPKHFDCVCNKCGGKCCVGQCDKQGLSEWPQVGDEVVYHSSTAPLRHDECNLDEGCIVDTWTSGDSLKVIAIVEAFDIKILPVVQNKRTKEVSSILTDCIKKPKTPEEELRDDIVWLTIKHMENKLHSIEESAYYLFSDLMGKYNITK